MEKAQLIRPSKIELNMMISQYEAALNRGNLREMVIIERWFKLLNCGFVLTYLQLREFRQARASLPG